MNKGSQAKGHEITQVLGQHFFFFFKECVRIFGIFVAGCCWSEQGSNVEGGESFWSGRTSWASL